MKYKPSTFLWKLCKLLFLSSLSPHSLTIPCVPSSFLSIPPIPSLHHPSPPISLLFPLLHFLSLHVFISPSLFYSPPCLLPSTTLNFIFPLLLSSSLFYPYLPSPTLMFSILSLSSLFYPTFLSPILIFPLLPSAFLSYPYLP